MTGDPLALAAKNLRTGARDPRIAWRQSARPDQLQPEGEWRTWLILGGRGSGKTRTGGGTMADWILSDPVPGEWAIIAPTYRDAWTVDVEGESGILRSLGTTMAEIKDGRSLIVKHAWRSHGEIILRSGHIIRVDSANDGALRVQGHNLKGVWADEIGLWQKWSTAWDESVQYAVRQGVSRIVATGTPKVSRPAAALIRRLLRDTSTQTRVTRLRTVDNLSNLSQSFYDSVVARSRGTRLEQQELEGLLLDDIEGALWTRELIEAITVGHLPLIGGSPGKLTRAYVGVDPSDGAENSDEQAYTVCGKGSDGKLYVVESFGESISPVQFAKKAIQAAIRWDARLVVERNHGGRWMVEVFRQAMREMHVSVPYEIVNASVGKMTRAEPVAALYERGVVRHVHWTEKDEDGHNVEDDSMTELEDQMSTFTGAKGEKSPDRLDSLVWAVTPFLNQSFSTTPVKGGVRRWDIQVALQQIEDDLRRGSTPHRRQQGYAGLEPLPDGVPDEELVELPMPGRKRPNVHSYADVRRHA